MRGGVEEMSQVSHIQLDVDAWLAYGEADLQAARTLYRAGHYMACAFHCHQALEKGLKAVWTYHHSEEPPPIHNLRLLLAHSGVSDMPDQVVEAVLLASPHYVVARIPGIPHGDIKTYTRERVWKLLNLVEEAWTWCLQTIK